MENDDVLDIGRAQAIWVSLSSSQPQPLDPAYYAGGLRLYLPLMAAALITALSTYIGLLKP